MLDDHNTGQDDDDAHRRIAQRAHEIWVQEGCPEGKQTEHWIQAESEVANPAPLVAAKPGESTGKDADDSAQLSVKPAKSKKTDRG